ncbi:MAG: hypothetical protein AAF170_20030 [Bacteroidota bacterium]
MTRSPHPIWTDAEALFAYAFAWVDVLSVASETITLLLFGCVLAGLALSAWWAVPTPASRASFMPPAQPMTRSFLLLAAALLAAPAFAQSNANPMERLAPFEGTYALDGEPHQQDGSFDGTLTVAPTLGGHFQQWDWTMTMRGEGRIEDIHLRFIVSYDAATGNYSVHRFDSRDASSPPQSGGAFDASRGRLQVNGNALVMAWTMVNGNDSPENGTFRNQIRVTQEGLHIETEGVPDNGSPVVAIATTRAARR